MICLLMSCFVRSKTELLDKKPLASEDTAGGAISTGSFRDEIGFSRCSFSWDTFPSESPTPAAPGTELHTRRRFELQFDGDVIFKKGCLNLIVGPTASGKVQSSIPFCYHSHHSDCYYYFFIRPLC